MTATSRLRDLTAKYWSAAYFIRRRPDPVMAKAAQSMLRQIEPHATGALKLRIAELKELSNERTECTE